MQFCVQDRFPLWTMKFKLSSTVESEHFQALAAIYLQ